MSAHRPPATTTVTALQPKRSLAERLNMDPEKLEFIRHAIANDAPDTELEYFLSFCAAKGLDPTARQVYFIRRDKNVKRGNEWLKEPTWTIQISIDGFRSMAETTGEYDGQDEAEFRYDESGRLVAGTVRVYRKGMGHPVAATAFWDEYVQTDRDGAPNSMWKRMAHNQLAKCAEALALRKAFPQKLGGIYTNEEMAQADNPERGPRSESTAELPEGSTKSAALGAKLAERAAAVEDATEGEAIDHLDDEEIVVPAASAPTDLNAMTPQQIGELVADAARQRGIQAPELRKIVHDVGGGRLTKSSAPRVLAALFEKPLVEAQP